MRCSRRSQKSIKKLLVLEVQRLSKSSMLIRLKNSSLVLAAIGNMPMPICNRFHERLANNGKVTTFAGVPLFRSLMPSCAGFLEPRKSRLGPSQSTLVLKISYAACLSQLISVQFDLEMCFIARNRQKIHKNPYFSV